MMTGEPRRIELTPVDASDKEKKKEKLGKTVRFNLTLTESSEATCPEFSYAELLKNAYLEKKKKKAEAIKGEKGKEKDPFNPLDPDDPFAAEDEAEHDKMLAIARTFEAKYGPKPGSKKKRKDRIEDLVDLGEGYDDADPFIDNTEAYDEIVPACLTTKFGGFYINSGVLDFREISDDEDDDFVVHRKKKKTKIITSDDEGERPELGPDGKKKRGRKKKIKDEDGDLLRKKRKKWAITSGEGGKLIKKRKLTGAKLGSDDESNSGIESGVNQGKEIPATKSPVLCCSEDIKKEDFDDHQIWQICKGKMTYHGSSPKPSIRSVLSMKIPLSQYDQEKKAIPETACRVPGLFPKKKYNVRIAGRKDFGSEKSNQSGKGTRKTVPESCDYFVALPSDSTQEPLTESLSTESKSGCKNTVKNKSKLKSRDSQKGRLLVKFSRVKPNVALEYKVEGTDERDQKTNERKKTEPKTLENKIDADKVPGHNVDPSEQGHSEDGNNGMKWSASIEESSKSSVESLDECRECPGKCKENMPPSTDSKETSAPKILSPERTYQISSGLDFDDGDTEEVICNRKKPREDNFLGLKETTFPKHDGNLAKNTRSNSIQEESPTSARPSLCIEEKFRKKPSLEDMVKQLKDGKKKCVIPKSSTKTFHDKDGNDNHSVKFLSGELGARTDEGLNFTKRKRPNLSLGKKVKTWERIQETKSSAQMTSSASSGGKLQTDTHEMEKSGKTKKIQGYSTRSPVQQQLIKDEGINRHSVSDTRNKGSFGMSVERSFLSEVENLSPTNVNVSPLLEAKVLQNTLRKGKSPSLSDFSFPGEQPKQEKPKQLSQTKCRKNVSTGLESRRDYVRKSKMLRMKQESSASRKKNIRRIFRKKHRLESVTPLCEKMPLSGCDSSKREASSNDGPKIKHTPTVAELIKRQVQSTTNGLEAASLKQAQQDSKLLMDLGDLSGQIGDSMINSILNDLDDGTKSPNPDKLQQLPSNMSPLLQESIDKIIMAANVNEEGKCKFFTKAVNKLLLNIELESRQMSTGDRNRIYTHLARYLPCGKETLMKRGKKLRLDMEDTLKEPIERLREEISRVMPAMIERYNIECAVAAQRQQEERAENREMASTESDEEKSSEANVMDKRRLPHRKFEWTAKIKEHVNEIVRRKMELYDLLKDRSTSPEEYLRAFLDSEIKPLWPKGWIQTRMIYKETRGTHCKWTANIANKPRKIAPSINPSTSVLPKDSLLSLDSLPLVDFDVNAPLPGGLASSGTEPISKEDITGAGVSFIKKPPKPVPCLTEPPRSTGIGDPGATPGNISNTSHLSTKSPLSGTPTTTSTPAQPGPASRNLLDYASESFLSAAKSKGGVLSMGTVLPDSVSISSSPSLVQSPALSKVSLNIATPATDSLRSISSILSKDSELPQQLASHVQPQDRSTPDTQSKMQSPPPRQSTSYQNTPLSSRGSLPPGAERYINQYKEFVGQMMRQQSTSPTSPVSSPLPGQRTFDAKKLSPPAPSSVSPKTTWDTQHIIARPPSTGSMAGFASQAAITSSPATTMSDSGIRNLATSPSSSSGISSSKESVAQKTQVHQVSSSLSKSQVQQQHSHGLKVSIPSSGQVQGHGLTSSQGLSPSQCSSSSKQHQRQSQPLNMSQTQRSPQGHGASMQQKSYQGQGHHESPSKSMVTVSTGGHNQRQSTVSGVHSVQRSPMSSTMTSQHNVRQTVYSVPMSQLQASQTSSAHTGSAHQGQNKSAASMAQVRRSSPVQTAQAVSYGQHASQVHSSSPSTKLGLSGYKPSQSGAHNGSKGTLLSSNEIASGVSLTQILDSEAGSKPKPKLTTGNSDVVYSSLTMSQILASGPGETRKHYQSTTTAKADSESHQQLWRTVDHATPSSATPPSPTSPFSVQSMAMSRASPSSTGVFITPTTSSLHSALPTTLRMPDTKKDNVSLQHNTPMQMTPGGHPMFRHVTPGSTVQNPHHLHSPQNRVTSPRHLHQPAVSPFGYPYTDPSQPHRF